MDYSYSRHANSAGLALPHIPRRTSSTRSPARTPPSGSPARSPPTTSPLSSPPTISKVLAGVASTKVIVQPPTPPDARQNEASAVASSSSNSSGSDTYVEILAPKARRARVHQRSSLSSLMCPPEQSTPTPVYKARSEKLASRVPFPVQNGDLEDTPRASTSSLVLDARPSPPRSVSDAQVLHPRSVSVSMGSIARKKSGEPLKSSLKSRRPVVRGDLSVITGPLNSTKSEPSTPTHIKSVHFDTQLEHVKLFLAEQKPLAVSRDGSPTDDTSGTDSDFPAFIYGDGKEEKKRKLELIVQGLRVESAEELARADVDVRLESLQLGADGTSIDGSVRVRNVAFEKGVAVRFTCDWWQTTSEVAARYAEAVPGSAGAFDRFRFTIRLNDMMGRIGEKTMFLAVRYTAAGREMWDNNAHQNYRITFAWKAEAAQGVRKAREAGRAASIADLKSKLEKVASEDESRMTVGGFLSSRSRAHANTSRSPSPGSTSPSPSPRERDADDEDSYTLKSKTPLASRYDFAASLKSTSAGAWRRASFFDEGTPTAANPNPALNERARTNTYPTALPHFPRRTGSHSASTSGTSTMDKRAFLAMTRGSPRIFDGDAAEGVRGYYAGSDLEDAPELDAAAGENEKTPVPAMSRKSSRNHQRGYFDLGVSPSGTGVRRTPPGTPFGSSSGAASVSVSGPARAASTIPVVSPASLWRVASGGSEESTPSSTSNEDSSRSSSPDESPYEGPVSLAPEDAFPRSPSPGDEASYSVFLNRFCFYTGPDTLLDAAPEIHRSHSASSVEAFLAASPYLGGGEAYLAPGQAPTRSSSCDDVAAVGSGLSTPTARSVAAGAFGALQTALVN
ncbi:hypothetical protein EIP86_010697 [Pleurotus ostreatoroseus]|nr:hypothetical protein EIP86_010697 [Pleurotus ostreatoroseus]